YFWSLSPQAGLLYPPAWVSAYEIYAITVYAFAIVGALAIVRSGTTEERNLLGMLLTIGLGLAVVHALAYVEGRHRWGIEPLLLLLTARGVFSVAGALFVPTRGSQLRGVRRVSARKLTTSSRTSSAE
ncbi:MAG TPA: hypothetical protein VGQ62_17995, partial [Chloroflexota bacterium]|nr:hypothetical protein [Chloroflexota bacterium]